MDLHAVPDFESARVASPDGLLCCVSIQRARSVLSKHLFSFSAPPFH